MSSIDPSTSRRVSSPLPHRGKRAAAGSLVRAIMATVVLLFKGVREGIDDTLCAFDISLDVPEGKGRRGTLLVG